MGLLAKVDSLYKGYTTVRRAVKKLRTKKSKRRKTRKTYKRKKRR